MTLLQSIVSKCKTSHIYPLSCIAVQPFSHTDETLQQDVTNKGNGTIVHWSAE